MDERIPATARTDIMSSPAISTNFDSDDPMTAKLSIYSTFTGTAAEI